MDPYLAGLTRETPFGFYQDDEDYGTNMADRDTVRPFSIGAFDDMHANPGGPYFDFRYGDIAVFSIDCRRFSTGRKPPREERSKLGAEQLQWLKTKMRQAADDDDVGLLVVASPQSFGSDASPASWHRHYPAEWEDLIDFFRNLNAPVLVVAGDAHGHRLHEYPQKNLDPGVPRIVEFVSAGTEHSRFSTFNEASFILRKANGMGFGLVELGPEQTIAGERVRSLTLTAVKTRDGTPFWTAQYTIVRDVGIFPLL
jgi:hypothetical protein